MKVWVLVLFVAGMAGDNLTVIDNIASLEECQRVGKQMQEDRINPDLRFRCYEVTRSQPSPQ